jgi:phosphoglycolate phosphatase
MRGFFDLILGADDGENPKPDPSLFLQACGLLHLEPREVVMVGDSPDDMETARRAGARVAVRIVHGDGSGLSSDSFELPIKGLDEILIFQGKKCLP